MITCWVSVSPNQAGNYLATPENRYAVLINIDARATLNTVTDALKVQGFDVTYSWQSGQVIRGEVFIDRWIRSLPTPASGKTWMYFEMDYTGSTPKTIVGHIEKCILSICGSMDVTNVFEAQKVADDFHPCSPGDPQGAPLAAPNPGSPAQRFQWQPAVAAGVFGLFVGWLIAR
jgi:hypothetical protein